MSLKNYLDIYDEYNKDALQKQKDALEATAQQNIKTIEDYGKAQEQETNEQYNELINTENVRRLINERKVAETMANMGLTDSGLNRTQQTAVQLSYGNAVSKAELARQKQVDAIAQYIQQQKGTIQTELNQQKASLDAAHEQNKTQWAGEQYNAQLEAEAEAIAELNKAQTANNSTRETFALAWNTDGATPENVTQLITNMELYPKDATWQKPAQNHIISLAKNRNTSEADMIEWINRYTNSYGTDKFILELTYSPEFKEHFNFDVTTGDVSKKTGRSHGTIDTENNTYNYVDDKGREQTVYGIGSDATMDGVDILDALTDPLNTKDSSASQIRDQLLDAFRTGGMDAFIKARQDAVEKGYSSYSIDHMMNQNFGDLWLLAAAKNDNYKGLSDSGIIKITDDGGTNWGWFFDAGKDQDVKISIKGQSKTVGEIFEEYKNKPGQIKRNTLNKILAQYGGW